jgi:hypothetical protein
VLGGSDGLYISFEASAAWLCRLIWTTNRLYFSSALLLTYALRRSPFAGLAGSNEHRMRDMGYGVFG